MGTIGGEHQELVLLTSLAPNVHSDVGRHAVPRLPDRVIEGHQSRLVRRKIANRTQRHPLHWPFPYPKDVAGEWDRQDHRGESTQTVGQPPKKSTALEGTVRGRGCLIVR